MNDSKTAAKALRVAMAEYDSSQGHAPMITGVGLAKTCRRLLPTILDRLDELEPPGAGCCDLMMQPPPKECERIEMLKAEVEKLRARLAGHDSPPENPWRPMSEAPRDGTKVLVFPATWSEQTCSVARFDDDRFAKKPRPYWRRLDDLGRTSHSRGIPPTHWMPLPPIPTGDDNG